MECYRNSTTQTQYAAGRLGNHFEENTVISKTHNSVNLPIFAVHHSKHGTTYIA